MKSSIIDRLSVIAGHRSKASREDAFWDDLRQIAKGCDGTLSQSTTNADRQDGDNMSSASRLFVLGLLRRSQAH
jgi:predicted DNA-binding ribbon-helix-helix protein